MEKLNNFSKVLLATSAINSMYHTIFEVHNNLKTIHHFGSEQYSETMKQVVKEGDESREQFLSEKLKDICAIVEDLGNFMNDADILSEIDLRITKVPMEVLLHGMDEVEKDYEVRFDPQRYPAMSDEDAARRREKGTYYYDDNGRQF